MSTRLDLYLTLERIMLEADDRDDPQAELIRDLMDPLWYELTEEEHALLDNRGLVSLDSLHPVRLPGGAGIFVAPSAGPLASGKVVEGEAVGMILSGWRTAA